MSFGVFVFLDFIFGKGDILLSYKQFLIDINGFVCRSLRLNCCYVILIFTLTRTLNRTRVKKLIGDIGIFDTKRAFYANKSFKNTIYSRFLEFKSRLAHQKKTRYLFQIPGFFFAFTELLGLKSSVLRCRFCGYPYPVKTFSMNQSIRTALSLCIWSVT